MFLINPTPRWDFFAVYFSSYRGSSGDMERAGGVLFRIKHTGAVMKVFCCLSVCLGLSAPNNSSSGQDYISSYYEKKQSNKEIGISLNPFMVFFSRLFGTFFSLFAMRCRAQLGLIAPRVQSRLQCYSVCIIPHHLQMRRINYDVEVIYWET